MLWEINDFANPTFFGYDSGVLGDINSLYIQREGSWTSAPIPANYIQAPIFRVVNTQQISEAPMDVTVDGWILPGSPAGTFYSVVA